MNEAVASAIVAFKTLSLLIGGLVTYIAYKAYRRTGSRALGILSVGFGIVTLGALLAGAVDLIVASQQEYALVVESALTTVGFAVILYSLYTE